MIEQILGLEAITSKTNSTIVKIGKLVKKKYRDEEKLFICDGVKLFHEAINFGAKIEYILLRDDADFDVDTIDVIKTQKANGTRVLVLNETVYSKVSTEISPQGIIAVCSYLDCIKYEDVLRENISQNEKVMMLESIRDPGNLGTIIRSAVAFGIDRLILSSDCVDIYSQKIIRAAMGAIFKLKINIVDDFVGAIKHLQGLGRAVLSATLNDKALVLGKRALKKTDVVIIGNEGHGLSEETINASNDAIIIPMEKNTESLNAAMASAIFMWELYK
jgi:TrmH family RNA methyltransferase